MKPDRLVSIALALLSTVLILANPGWTDEAADWTTRGGLALALTGILAGGAHGAGVQAQSRPLQVVASPRIAWPAMLAGLALMVLAERW